MLKENLQKFKENSRFNITLPDSFVEDFVTLFKSGEFDGIVNFFKKEYKGKLTTKDDFDITDRVLKHWETVGIIPNNRSTNGKWRKYSYQGYVWTFIAMQLRGFGFGLNNIKAVRDYLSNFREDTQSEYPLLILFFAYAVSDSDTILLLVYDDGVAELTLKSDYILFLSETQKIPRHIVINVTNIMQAIDKIFPEKPSLGNQNNKKLDIKEEKIIEVFRKKEVTEIIIKKANNKSHISYSSKANPKDKALFKKLSEIRYGDMAIAKAHGKVIDVKITKKEQL